MRIVVALVVQLVEKTGKRAAVGSLQDIGQIVAGTAGTHIDKIKRFA
jgi:carbamate kinase